MGYRTLSALLQEDAALAAEAAQLCATNTQVARCLASIVQLACSQEVMRPAALSDGLCVLHALTASCCTHDASAGVPGHTTHALMTELVSQLADAGSLVDALSTADPVACAGAVQGSPAHCALRSWLLLTWQACEILLAWPQGAQRAILEDADTAARLMHVALLALHQFAFPEGTALACRCALMHWLGRFPTSSGQGSIESVCLVPTHVVRHM